MNRSGLSISVVLLLGAGMAHAVTAGNGFYQVAVEDANSGVGIGAYTASTDILHDVTIAYGPQNVLFGGGVPSTSWSAIHSYTSDTTYTQRRGQSFMGGAPVPLILEDFVVAGDEADPVGTTGFRTHYQILNAGSGNGPNDDLDVFQTLSAVGTTFNDSAVEITTEVFNLGTHDIQVGIRYLLDFQIGGGEDGPSFQLDPNGSIEFLEQHVTTPTADTFVMHDNNDPNDFVCQFGSFNTPFPFFEVGGSVRGPSRLQPSAPTLLQYVSWPHISGLPSKFVFFAAQDAFDYAVGPTDTASCVLSFDDSGAAYYWGEAQGNAFTLGPGKGAKVTAYLFANLPGQRPTFPPAVEDCNDGIDNDGDGLIDAQDPDCAPLLVDLASFDATPVRRGIRLTWSTASELDNAGFMVMRSTSPSGPFVSLTPFLIPARGSDVSGATYTFVDRGVGRRKVYYYTLVDVDLSGRQTEHGPLAVSIGGPKPERRRR